MPDYVQMILELRRVGITARSIAAFGLKNGRTFSHHTIKGIVHHNHVRVRQDIAQTIQEMHSLFVSATQ